MAKTYQQEIAEWRVARQQQQIADRLNQIKSEYAEVQRERDQLVANGDLETAAWRDDDCKRLEDEWRYYNPPRQFSDQDVAYLNKKRAYRERYGQVADQLIARAHRQAVMPRNPHASSATHPDTYGSGLRQGTAAYYKAID